MTNQARALIPQTKKTRPAAVCADVGARQIPIRTVSRAAVEELVARLNSSMAGA